MNTRQLRTSAANLNAIIAAYETHARHSTGVEATAWNDAVLRLLDAADALSNAAEDLEGEPRLPFAVLPMHMPMRVGGGAQ